MMNVALFETNRTPMWKWVVGVLAAIVSAPFLALALGITVVLLAPFAIPVLPVIAYTLFTKERPAITPLSTRSPRTHRRFAHG